MSRIEEIKEGNARWRLIFGLTAATYISLIAWLIREAVTGGSRYPIEFL